MVISSSRSSLVQEGKPLESRAINDHHREFRSTKLRGWERVREREGERAMRQENNKNRDKINGNILRFLNYGAEKAPENELANLGNVKPK